MPFYPCRVCGKITKSPTCREHKPKRDRPSSTERGYDARWRRTREAFLHVNPVCERCGAPAEHVHHIDGLGPRGPLGFAWDNLEATCAACHNEHHANERRKNPRERL